MRIPRRRNLLIAAGVLLVLITAGIVFGTSAGAGKKDLVAKVKRGDFKIVVTTTGELQARKFVQVQGPTNAQQAGQYQMRISSLVPEGTIVKTGDVVGELDRGGIAARVQEVSLALQKADAQMQQAQLDSTLTLAQAREEIRNLEYSLEERQIIKDQSTYEAPSVKRQAEIDLDKAKRALEQAKANYITKKLQAEAKMREVGSEVQRQGNMLKIVQDVMVAFTIRAPSPGMVIYTKEWNGQKKTVGSQVSPWDPTIATLPDLTEMESVTYVNEIDVRKIAKGQRVDISLDADPGKKLTGKVVEVANVGEQRPNADAKVFEVKIDVAQVDTTLRPGMTTGNSVLTSTIRNVLYVPLEAVTTVGTETFVYRRGARGHVVRQQVVTGDMNEDEVIIVKGLKPGDEVLLTPPVDGASLPLKKLPAPKPAPKPQPAKLQK